MYIYPNHSSQHQSNLLSWKASLISSNLGICLPSSSSFFLHHDFSFRHKHLNGETNSCLAFVCPFLDGSPELRVLLVLFQPNGAKRRISGLILRQLKHVPRFILLFWQLVHWHLFQLAETCTHFLFCSVSLFLYTNQVLSLS